MFPKMVIFDSNVAGSRAHGWGGNEIYTTFIVFKNHGMGVDGGQ
jgi:hypothetical protein